ncbi:MAG: glycosyltransferase family 4 protein [Zavarzinella sp.]
MKILHLTASTFWGGPERQMLGLAQALPFEYQTFFASFAENGRCQPFLEKTREAGFESYRIKSDTPHLQQAVGDISQLIRQIDADVLLCHGYKSNLLGRLAARTTNVPCVAVSRGWTGETWKVQFYDWLDRKHLRCMNRVVCVSTEQARRVRKTGVPASKIRVIKNAMRDELLEPLHHSQREKLANVVPHDRYVILGAGRLSPEKGYMYLVKSMVELVKQHPNVLLLLCGEGPERGAIEEFIRHHMLHDHVRLLGFRTDVDQLLAMAQVMILPSLTEGLPNIALEAAARRIPTIATAVGGTPEIVKHLETGLLVPPEQENEISRQIIWLMKNPHRAEQLVENAQEHVVHEFSFRGQAAKYVELFEELVAVPSAGGTWVC